MPNDDKKKIIQSEHFVASTTESDGPQNIIKDKIQITACWKVKDFCFDFGSAFVRTNSIEDFEDLFVLYEETKKEWNGPPPVAIFGHADPVGKDDFNKKLSENRARAIYGVLTKDVDIWADIFSDEKDAKHLQQRLKDLKEVGDDELVHPGEVDGIIGHKTKDAIKAYMEKLCSSKLEKKDFFTESGAEGEGKCACQGCSEFNPLLMFSKTEWDEYKSAEDKTRWNEENEVNRRVIIYLFKPGTIYKQGKWPCSAGTVEGCKKRFYSNSDIRRQFQANPKTYHKDKDTFACRFYDRLFDKPCENNKAENIVCCIDSHMHINSGNCAPLPLLWDKVPTFDFFKPKRSIINWFAERVKEQVSKVQPNETNEIGDNAVRDNESTFEKNIYKDYKKKDMGNILYTPMVVMPMDMEYAHIDGYKGEKIYKLVASRYYYYSYYDEGGIRIIVDPDKLHNYNYKDLYEEKGPYYYYYDRKSVKYYVDEKSVKDEQNKTLVWLKLEETDMYQDWILQKKQTVAACLKHPWKLLPMFHYDPRRWRKENWRIPFNDIATKKGNNEGMFIGFKMYTALGYKPLDAILKKGLSNFYQKCKDEEIPILCHCSPGGMYTHDRDMYLDFDYKKNPGQVEDYKRTFWFDKKVDYFNDKFVHPGAWGEVLEKYSGLKLCLAHFGGSADDWKDWSKAEDIEKWYAEKEEEKCWIKQIVRLMKMTENKNLYTDISCHFIENHKNQFKWLLEKENILIERILFGTDWYMTLLNNKAYDDYCMEAKEVIDDISLKVTGDPNKLWIHFTLINPMKYYGLKNNAKCLAEGLKSKAKELIEEEIEIDLNEIEKGLKIIEKLDPYVGLKSKN
ncbi:MAG: amidohydrolase family protein [Desulfobacteraceae bacterium]|nr:amidohydrolase family protein [Desulfobacteraceae bacterium]MBC2719681.1 amidohydrolase family protein [Desulfobacteraceae bacterium]